MLRSELKRSFSPEEITKLVTVLGSDPPRLQGEALVFQTICHNPAHTGSYKLFYYQESGLFHCYTQCGDSFDIYELVQRNKHCSFKAAVTFIQETLGISFESRIGFQPALSDDWDYIERYSRMKQAEVKEGPSYSFIPSSLLDFYTPLAPVEWLQEGISRSACECFDIRFDVSKNEIIIPHFDIDRHLVGLRSRALDHEKVAAGFKYMPTQLENQDFRHALRFNLYGLHKTKTAIQRIQKAILFEAEKSVLLCETYYGNNNFAVAVCGSNISTYQRDLLIGLGVREVFLAFDKEYAEAYTDESDNYADKILKLASMFTPYATTYVLWDTQGLLNQQDSPADRGKEVLEQLMKTKFEVKIE